MAHALRPRTAIRKFLQQSGRSISSAPSCRLPEVQEEQTEDLLDPSSEPNDFLSSRSDIDAFLRTQNDVYLAKVKQHLESINNAAEALNQTLPTLSRRAKYVQPPSSSITPREKTAIPPYTVTPWRNSTQRFSKMTQELLNQTERVTKNIEDLQAEPYRADVSPSAREKVNKKVADWSKEDKERELLDAELEQKGIVARFNMEVNRLENNVKAMAAASHEVQRQTTGSSHPEISFESRPSTDMMSRVDGAAVSFSPIAADSGTAAAGTPKVQGWGSSSTKVGNRMKGPVRTENPFKQTATNSVAAMGALRKQMQSSSNSELQTAKVDEDAAEPKAEAKVETKDTPETKAEPKGKTETKAEPKLPSLAELQRRMNASQKKED